MRVNTVAARLVLVFLALAARTIAAPAPDIDPAAVKLFKRMTDHLAGLKAFSLDTTQTVEVVYESGQKIHHDLSSKIVAQRPNKLRAERTGDLVRQVAYYDGKTLTIHEPDANCYAVASAPPTIDGALHFARESLDIVPPAGDLMFTDSFDLLTAGVTSATVVGPSSIGGVTCDHLAFTGTVVDWQIWIPAAGDPLPRKYVVITKDDPAQPEYVVLMSNWNVAPQLTDSQFTFTPPKDAKRTDFLHVDAARKSGN